MKGNLDRAIVCLLFVAAMAGSLVDALQPRPLPRGNTGPPDVLFPVLLHGKVGYIDRAGRLVLPARYDPLCERSIDAITMASVRPSFRLATHWAGEFRHGRCAVKMPTGIGLIDTTGRVLEPDLPEPRVAALAEAARGQRDAEWRAAAVKVANPARLFDRSARTTVDVKNARTRLAGAGYRLADDRAWILAGTEIGVADVAGKPVLKPQLVHVEPFRGGLALVATLERRQLSLPSRWLRKIGLLPKRPLVVLVAQWGYIDRSGQWVWRPTR